MTFNNVQYYTVVTSTGECVSYVESCDFGSKSITILSEAYGYPVVGIKHDAFKDNQYLEEVHLPETIRDIGIRAFDNCNNLRIVTIQGTPSIHLRDYAFCNCQSLEKIQANDGCRLHLDGFGVFKVCKVLQEIPAIYETIPDYSFMECGLKSVLIIGKATLKTAGFFICSIKEIYVEELLSISGNFNFLPDMTIITATLTDAVEYLFHSGFSVKYEPNIFP